MDALKFAMHPRVLGLEFTSAREPLAQRLPGGKNLESETRRVAGADGLVRPPGS